MKELLQLPAYPTQRPAWIDPARVSAILDLVEFREPKLVGGPPEGVIVGTCVVVDGRDVELSGPAADVRLKIETARKALPFLNS